MSVDRRSQKGQGEGFVCVSKGCGYLAGVNQEGCRKSWRTATAQCSGLREERGMVEGWRKQELSWELC